MDNKQNFKKNLELKNKLKYKQYYSLKILTMNSLELENFLKEEEKEKEKHKEENNENYKTRTGPQWNHESRENFQLGLTAVFME